MDPSYLSPEPGNWLVDTPYGWESEPKEIEYRALMAELYPEDYSEDPTLKAMRLEAEAEQEAEYDAKRPTIQQYAHKMKELFNAKKALKFSDDLSAVSIGSFETDDFMSEPDSEIMRLRGEIGYLEAYKAKAIQRKKLRKLLSGAPTGFESSPAKIKMPSPKKPSPKKPSPKKLSPKKPSPKKPSPKKSPQKLFAPPVLDSSSDSSSSSDSDIQIPLPKTATLAKAGAKKFFQPPQSPTPVKSSSPMKLKTPIKSPSPPRARPSISKGFFAAPNFSDDDSPIKIPSPPKVTSPARRSFFAAPTLDNSSVKTPSPPKMKALVNKAFFPKMPVLDSDSDSDSDSDEPIAPMMKVPKLPAGKIFSGAGSPKGKISPFKKAAQAALLASRKTDTITMTALDSELHDRLKYLQKVATADDIYRTSKLLPDNVNQFILSRKGTPAFLELALDLETLIINTMISKIEAGITRISPNALLNDAKAKLAARYKSLSGNMAALI